MKTKKNIKNNNSQTIKSSNKTKIFDFLNKSHLHLIHDYIQSNNAFKILDTIVSKFGIEEKEKNLKKYKYIKDLEEKIFNDLQYKRKSKEYVPKMKYTNYYVTIKTNKNNKIRLFVKKRSENDNISYSLYLEGYNNIEYDHSEAHNVVLELTSNDQSEIYIGFISKSSKLSGSKSVQIALEICKSLYPKHLSIYDAATIEKNPKINLAKYFEDQDFFSFKLSLSRILSKDISDLSWYNSFGFSLDKQRASNGFYNKEKIDSDLNKLRKFSINDLFLFLNLLKNNKNYFEVFAKKSKVEYTKIVSKDENKFFHSLLKIASENKDKILKDFINILPIKEKVYFLDTFFSLNAPFVGILKDRKFVKSPFYDYLYILKYIGGERSMDL